MKAVQHASGAAARTFDRILIIKPSSLGDVIHALPVLDGLRRAWPAAKIDWLVGEAFAGILEGHPAIDTLIRFDRRRFARLLTSPTVAMAFLSFCRDLRQRAYDLVIDLQGLFRSGWLSRATRAPLRLGFSDAREGATLFYNQYMPRFPQDTHAVDRNLSALSMLGIEVDQVRFDLPVDPQAHARVEKLLLASDMGSPVRVVAVVPGGRWETKVWFPDRFSATINALQEAPDVRCVLLGAGDERDLCERISRGCTHRPLTLAGRTSLPELVAVLARASAVLCHDSAAAHMAAALSRPLVCLTGPTNPRRTGPYGRLGDVVQLPLDCAPCYLRKLAKCRFDHRCMRDLSVASVVQAVGDRLAPPAHARAKMPPDSPLSGADAR